jgi:hypothetical protein
MPIAIRQMNGHLGRFALALCLLGIALSGNPAPAAAAEAAMSVSLPAGKHKAVRLRNLPQGAIMGVAVQSSGPIAVSLLSEQDYRRFPSVQDPVFLGTVGRKLSFTVTIPATGNFYLVLDNRRSEDARKVKFLIRAQRGPAQQSPESSQPGAAPKAGEIGT